MFHLERAGGQCFTNIFFFFFFFFFFRGVGSLSQPRLNIFTVGNMRVMICLGQGGLRSLSASSYLMQMESLLRNKGPLRKARQNTTLYCLELFPGLNYRSASN